MNQSSDWTSLSPFKKLKEVELLFFPSSLGYHGLDEWESAQTSYRMCFFSFFLMLIWMKQFIWMKDAQLTWYSYWNDITPLCEGKIRFASALIVSIVIPTNIVECSFIGCIICGKPFWSPIIAPVSSFTSLDVTSDSECFTHVYLSPVGLQGQNGRNRNCSHKIWN